MIQGFSSSLLGNRELIYETDLPSFQRDFASLKTLDHGYGPNITFTRASNATFFDVDGVLQTAANNVPRFDHDPADGGKSLGLLIEEARTNSIRNSQAGGAVAGTAGTGPTNWNVSGSAVGLTRTISLGTINGFSYIDVRLVGTATSTVQAFFDPEGLTALTASAGQTWTISAYIALVAGSVPDCLVGIREGLADSTFVTGGSFNAGPSLTSSLQRFSHTRTLTDATTARVTPTIRVSISNGVAYDFTLRIAAPQLEQGAFPTSYIPTTTAAATRSADSAVVTPISSFYNGTEGTIYNEFSVPVLDGASTLRGVTQFAEAAATTNRLQTGYRGTGAYRFDVVAANSSEATIESLVGAVTAGAVVKSAQAYKSTDNARSLNGAAVATSSSAITTPTRERFRFGDNGTAILNGHIRKVAYWPKRLSNTLLEQLTT